MTVAALCAYRLTRLVTLDDLPPVKKAREAFIRRAGETSAWAEMIECPWCAGAWISFGVALAAVRSKAARRVMLGPALSGVVGLLAALDSHLGA